MSRDQEIKELATKLHSDGVAQSFMDAVRMAESMITTDMSPSKTPISNVEYEKPATTQTQSTAPMATEQIVAGIKEEVAEIEAEPQTFEEKEAEILETPENSPEARSAASIEQEIEAVETETEPIQEQIDEKETEDELQDPAYLKKEEDVVAAEVSEADVASQIFAIENEAEPEDEIVAEEEAEEMLVEPEVVEPRTTESEILSEIQEVESEPNAVTEVVDTQESEVISEPVSSHADVDDDDEFIVSSDDITKLF